MSDTLTPAHIKRVGTSDFEALLRQTVGEAFGGRFVEYRANYNKTLEYDRHGYLPDFPLTVLLELLNRCNLECIMCYSTHRKGPRVVITEETIGKLFREFKDNGLPALMFGAGEEPLLYKSIDRLLDMTNAAGIMDTFLFTNGTLLNQQRCDMLVEKRVGRVMISVDAATGKTYDTIRLRNRKMTQVGANRLKELEDNVRRLIATRERKGSKLPLVRLSFAVQPENADEIGLFKEKWKDVVDFIEFQACSDYAPIDQLARLSEEERWKRIPLAKGQAKPRCPQPWGVLTVWYNGDVMPCCSFNGKNLPLGNIGNATLAELWRGDKINELRAQFRCGEINIVCQKCLATRDWAGLAKAAE